MFGAAGIYSEPKKDEFNPKFKVQYFYNINDSLNCSSKMDCNRNEYCDIGNSGLCELCPGLEESCAIHNCCNSLELHCVNDICECNYEYNPTCGTYNGAVFFTASQVALSAALIMGIAALAMVVYRLCARPKYLSARQRAALARSRQATGNNDPVNSFSNDIRASLSSMQIRVINRLRDRPPTYDGINNIASTNDRNINGSSSTTINTASSNNSIVSIHRNIETMPPPPYINSENGPELELHRPPPYTEVILCPAGYLNESYANTENNNHQEGIQINNSNDGENNSNNITINISDNITTIQKERSENGSINNNNIEMKIKNNDNNVDSRVNDKDSNNNSSNR